MGTFRPRRFDALQDYLRDLRLNSGWTQKDVSDLSRDQLVEVSRSYLAGLENSGLPETVSKFLSVLKILGADLQLAQELAELHLGRSEGVRACAYSEIRSRSMAEFQEGRFEIALGWLFSALNEAVSRGDLEDEAKVLVSIANTLRRQGRPRAAQRFASRALELNTLSPPDRTMAIQAYALSHLSLGCPDVALSILKSVPRGILRSRRGVRAALSHNTGACLRTLGEYAKAADAYAVAADLSPSSASNHIKSLSLAGMAFCRTMTGECDDPVELNGARDLTRRGSAPHTMATVEYFGGRSYEALGRAGLAHDAYQRSRALGTLLNHDGILFEAELRLFRLALERRHYKRSLRAQGLCPTRLIRLRSRLVVDQEDELLFQEVESSFAKVR